MNEIHNSKTNIAQIPLRKASNQGVATTTTKHDNNLGIKIVKHGSALRRFGAEPKVSKDGCGY